MLSTPVFNSYSKKGRKMVRCRSLLNPDQSDKESRLLDILLASPAFRSFFECAHKIHLPNWYLAGGALTQTVWNALLGLDPLHGLKDLDIVYFNRDETEVVGQLRRIEIQSLLAACPLVIDVVNQARVHEWYPEKYGYEIAPYHSSEEGMSTWLPAFCVGVTVVEGALRVFAPRGLEDTFAMVVRPNKRQITEEIYQCMTTRLTKAWPAIKVMPWS